MNILIVEDDRAFADLIAKFLSRQGFITKKCHSVKEADEVERSYKYDLIILDLMLGHEHGIELIRKIKNRKNNKPIIVLSGVVDVENKIALINSGADDYITKPVNPNELLARVNAVLRRSISKVTQNKSTVDDLEFLWDAQLVKKNEIKMKLTQKETSLLKILVTNKNMVVEDRQLISEIWNTPSGSLNSNSLQSLIKRVRKRMLETFNKNLIKNVYGVGYMFITS